VYQLWPKLQGKSQRQEDIDPDAQRIVNDTSNEHFVHDLWASLSLSAFSDSETSESMMRFALGDVY
jgi:uncharacterized membrane-anchored protein YjiN (DUF445 family)